MEYEEVYSAVTAAIIDHQADENQDEGSNKGMMSIHPFSAVDEDDNNVSVVGVIDRGDDIFDFIVIKHDPECGGEMWPTTLSSVWPKPSTAQVVADARARLEAELAATN